MIAYFIRSRIMYKIARPSSLPSVRQCRIHRHPPRSSGAARRCDAPHRGGSALANCPHEPCLPTVGARSRRDRLHLSLLERCWRVTKLRADDGRGDDGEAAGSRPLRRGGAPAAAALVAMLEEQKQKFRAQRGARGRRETRRRIRREGVRPVAQSGRSRRRRGLTPSRNATRTSSGADALLLMLRGYSSQRPIDLADDHARPSMSL